MLLLIFVGGKAMEITMSDFKNWYFDLKADFILNFIEENRWKFIFTGLGNTIIITFAALIIGVILGAFVAIVRSSYDKTNDEVNSGFKKFFFSILNGICKLYLTVIRGTQLLYSS